MTPEWTLLQERLAEVEAGPAFQPDELAELPEPVVRYLAASIAPGTPLARAAILTMRGSIKIGRWLPFRARQLQRWGDPEGTGAWDLYPFGVEATSWARFGGSTIPSGGQAGWHHGTDRWANGVFFRFEITGYELLTPP